LRIQELKNLKVDFAIETTLTTLSYKNLIADCKSIGYEINLVYFWLKDYNIAIDRIKERVKIGEHNVEDEIVIRRYFKGIKNFNNIFINLVDNWFVYDNSGKSPELVACGNSDVKKIINNETWQKLIG
jgi:predicted ABC-type ATPase